MTFEPTSWWSTAGVTLGERVMAEIFERQAFLTQALAVEERTLENILMKSDTSQISALDDELVTIQWPDLMAGWGGKILDDMAATIEPPGTRSFDTYVAYSKASYEPKIADQPYLMAARDVAAQQQLITRKNWVLIEGIVDNKANAVDDGVVNEGHLTFQDLLNIKSKAAENGYSVDTFVTTPALLSDLLGDPQVQSRNTIFVANNVDRNEGEIWEIQGMGWKVISSRHMEDPIESKIAGEGLCIGYNWNSYCLLGYARTMNSAPFDKSLTGDGFAKGMVWYEQYGVGRYEHGDDACAYVDCTP